MNNNHKKLCRVKYKSINKKNKRKHDKQYC